MCVKFAGVIGGEGVMIFFICHLCVGGGGPKKYLARLEGKGS